MTRWFLGKIRKFGQAILEEAYLEPLSHMDGTGYLKKLKLRLV